MKEDWRGEYYEFTGVTQVPYADGSTSPVVEVFKAGDVWADIRDVYIEPLAWGLQFEEKPMTPNERLLKAAREIIAEYNSPGDWKNYPAFDDLESAVKACEAAEAPSITFVDPIAQPPTIPAKDGITDQQRRMGLRSTRHVTNRSDWDD